MTRTTMPTVDRMLLALLTLAALHAPTSLAAQGAPPGCRTPMHRQFDFWIGDWTVTDSAGKTVYGRNRITNEEDGCAIHEHWTSAGNPVTTGQSLNGYDFLTKGWSQDWIGSGGDVLHLRGGLRDGKMVLEGEGLTPAGAKIMHRAIWSLEPDGRVRQFWVTSANGGATWDPFFDGWYRKER